MSFTPLDIFSSAVDLLDERGGVGSDALLAYERRLPGLVMAILGQLTPVLYRYMPRRRKPCTVIVRTPDQKLNIDPAVLPFAAYELAAHIAATDMNNEWHRVFADRANLLRTQLLKGIRPAKIQPIRDRYSARRLG